MLGKDSVEAFFERLIRRAATIDELLSDEFEALPGQKGDADLAGARLAAWCQSCASGDWSLFGRRLERDRLSIVQVLERLGTVRPRTSAEPPDWIRDAIWIDAALRSPTCTREPFPRPDQAEPCPFEHLFVPLVELAETMLWHGIEARVFDNLNKNAHACLRQSLLRDLSRLSAPAIYERFSEARKAGGTLPDAGRVPQGASPSRYSQFVAEMKGGGFLRLFEDKPVLLRLMASLTRQWIDTWREFALRLDADLATIRSEFQSGAKLVAGIEGDLSDPHNEGHSVQIVTFEDGSKVVYKPKDLRLDAAWYALVERLNLAGPPIDLKAVRALPRDGYGWTEFIDHVGCADEEGCRRFFRRAGAWLALLHCFTAADTHQENIIATGEHPVPIDLEMILQAVAEEYKVQDPEGAAYDAALETIGNSVTMVGLLPAYGRSADNRTFAMGGLISDWSSKIVLGWSNMNSDEMRPAKFKVVSQTNPNLPHVDGRYSAFDDHTDDFIAGFEDYAKFLLRYTRDEKLGRLFDGFSGLTVRRVIRPTRFYYLLLQRLKDHRTMNDGVLWSAQADFVARLAEWDNNIDPLWPLQRAERTALIALNVPHFVSPCDGNEIRSADGDVVRTRMDSGLDRARARVQSLDEPDIAWQIEVIRANTASPGQSGKLNSTSTGLKEQLNADPAAAPAKEMFVAEADRIAGELARRAIRRGPGAAWIGFDWLGDADVFQLVCLGPDLYNGVSGIGLFLAAHAKVSGCETSGELALAGLSHFLRSMRSRNSACMARALGIGGATGLGSIVYALAVMAKCLGNEVLLAQAHAAAALITDDLIAADKQLDVMGGSAGAILGLLRLYRDSRSDDVLRRAVACGEHLTAQPRFGSEGRRSWVGQGSGAQALNGMSHGAAGFAYALSALAAETGREDFAHAASECVDFENASYDAQRQNWPDLRTAGAPLWPCQWCHGAPGIGLARLAMSGRGGMDARRTIMDIQNAIAGTQRGWPARFDTLCCGTLGAVEFFCEAGRTLERDDLLKLAARQLTAVMEQAASTGDYRWNSGKRQFNLGLFRGLAGVGYTALRQVDASLPNVLIWE